MTDQLWDLLGREEKKSLQTVYNRMFKEISNILLFSISVKEFPCLNTKTAINLVARGISDLESVSCGFTQRDPHASLWGCQQAVEKFLKAFLTLTDDALAEDVLRKRFGHHVGQLVEAASNYDAYFTQVKTHVGILEITPTDRYTFQKMTPSEGIERINLSFAVCNLVAVRLILRLRQP